MSFREELVEHLPSLRAFAISLCGQPHQADDLVQETLLKALANRNKFEAGTNLRAWLFTILRNVYFSLHRKRRREVEDVDGALTASLVAKPEQYGHVDLKDFQRALLNVPDEQREALLLVGAAGFSYEEAATVANCAIGTVKSRVNRARARLAKDLGMTEDEVPAVTSDESGGLAMSTSSTPVRATAM